MLLHRNWLTRIGVGSALSLAALSLVGCNTTGPETGTDVEDIEENPDDLETPTPGGGDDESDLAYDGVYDQSFYDDIDSLDGQTVTVSANVNEIISENGFTIAGTDETTVDELLVVHDGSYPELAPGLTVSVTGTVHSVFGIEEVQSDTGVELDQEAYADWESSPYIEATSVDLSVPAEPGDADDTNKDETPQPDQG